VPSAVSSLASVTAFLKARRLTHLRCRARAGAIVVESDSKKAPTAHIRLKQLMAGTWAVDEFHRSGRWSPLPIQGDIDAALTAVLADFPWVLEA
jgi:hypothetical protein